MNYGIVSPLENIMSIPNIITDDTITHKQLLYREMYI